MFLCTVWLGNRVEAMEFNFLGIANKGNITDGHNSDSDLHRIIVSRNRPSASGTHAAYFHQL